MLLLADDAALLGLHQVGLLQTTGRVLRRAVPHLGLRADRRDLLAAGYHRVVFAVLASCVHAARHHVVHFYFEQIIYVNGSSFETIEHSSEYLPSPSSI
jgi:hypothetical protein